MKTRNRLSIFASIAALALVGTGYAAWQFNNSVENIYKPTAVVTEKNVEDGVITLDHETFYLILDQDFIGWSTEAYVAETSAEGVVTDNIDAVKAAAITTITPTLTLTEGTATTLDDFVYSCEFANVSSLDAYVDFGEFATTWVSGTAMNLPTVEWVEGMKPTIPSEYDTMKAAINGAEVIFTFNADLRA